MSPIPKRYQFRFMNIYANALLQTAAHTGILTYLSNDAIFTTHSSGSISPSANTSAVTPAIKSCYIGTQQHMSVSSAVSLFHHFSNNHLISIILSQRRSILNFKTNFCVFTYPHKYATMWVKSAVCLCVNQGVNHTCYNAGTFEMWPQTKNLVSMT